MLDKKKQSKTGNFLKILRIIRPQASISIILDISLALITKLVKDEVQGFATGVRRFFSK